MTFWHAIFSLIYVTDSSMDSTISSRRCMFWLFVFKLPPPRQASGTACCFFFKNFPLSVLGHLAKSIVECLFTFCYLVKCLFNLKNTPSAALSAAISTATRRCATLDMCLRVKAYPCGLPGLTVSSVLLKKTGHCTTVVLLLPLYTSMLQLGPRRLRLSMLSHAGFQMLQLGPSVLCILAVAMGALRGAACWSGVLIGWLAAVAVLEAYSSAVVVRPAGWLSTSIKQPDQHTTMTMLLRLTSTPVQVVAARSALQVTSARRGDPTSPLPTHRHKFSSCIGSSCAHRDGVPAAPSELEQLSLPGS